MKILLAVPTVDTCYEYVQPIGLMNLALIARGLGAQVDLVNLSSYSYKKGLARILSGRYDLVGVSCNFTNAAPYSMRYARDIKKVYPGTVVISGGNHATLLPEDLLFNGYDSVVYGEGEATFREFVQCMLAGKPTRELAGTCYLDNGKVKRNPAREPIQDMDTLPFNDYAEFDLEPYFKWAHMRYINIETCRGCIYNCAFCATVRMWGHKYRHKSPERIVREFKVAQGLKCDFVFLADDDTAIDEKHLRNFCALLIKEKASVPWGTTIGCNSIKDESTYDLMAASGCIKVNICIESANPRILKAYRKSYTIEDNRRACISMRKRGITVHNHGIIGFPDETIRESLNTYFYLIKTSPIWHISILEPRPGTDYWETWDKKGDPSQYKLFGKANVILSRKKISSYVMYRAFALFYFLNPRRIWNAAFHRVKGTRYSYWIQYYVAYRTLTANFLISLETMLGRVKKLLRIRPRHG
ncbi:MAG: radical SAM protein [Candidatus Omnitrophica bacterium]|nr:radical SAM protein [Candidatus Omnitrophota bacterium]